MPPSSILIT